MGPYPEWHGILEMDWGLKLYPIHEAFYQMMKTLSTFYKEKWCLLEIRLSGSWKGFKWVKLKQQRQSLRLFKVQWWSRNLSCQRILTIKNYLMSILVLPKNAEYKLVFSSNAIPIEPFSLHVQGRRSQINHSTIDYLLFPPCGRKWQKQEK